MTLEAQNEAIAIECGWRRCRNDADGNYTDDPTGPYWRNPAGHAHRSNKPPNYTGSLDAMHEAVNTLPPEKRDLYQNWLSRVCARKRRMAPISWLMLTAEATDQAEAFLRAVGRWQEKGEK